MDNDLLLIAETLQGKRAAFQALVEKYKDYVFTIAFKVLKNREDAEEAAQDTFLKVYKALGSFEQRSKFSTWLYQIAWRASIDRQRSRPQLNQSIDDEKTILNISDETPTPSGQLNQKYRRQFIQQALDNMKPEDATLMTLYYLHEQSVKEIASVMRMTESNVKVKLFRLRDAMKTQLNLILKNEVNSLL